ncbi:ComEC/Rec2 family competence protein [Rhodococcus daqingensis]|uniref:ComEC/Rec2 family competence protein n=1 Tax=Rhodococcus daqingensis TaxID=2479363 RepID=A0ABW2S4S9_9NOCA
MSTSGGPVPGGRMLDLRLLPSAGTCWGATILGIELGWRAALWVAAGAALAATIVAVSGIRRSAAGVLIAALLVGAGFAVAAGARERAVAEHPLAAIASRGGHVNLTVVPVDDPRPVRSPAGDTVMIRASLRSVDARGPGEGGYAVGGAVVIFAPAREWQELLPGQEVTLRGKVSRAARRDLTVATIRATGAPLSVEPAPWTQRAAGVVRERFATAARSALPPEPAGLLPGLVVGDTSALPGGVRDDFTAAGLSHLTAVSGANISILIGAVLLLMRTMALGPRTSAVLAAAALVAFVILARPSPSVLRAAAMGSIALLAMMTGRRKQAMPALGAAVIGLIALFPALALSFGFALSVAATAALVLLAPAWTQWLRARGWPRAPAEAVAVAGAAYVATVPIVAAMSGTLSTVAVIANLAVAPVIAPVTVIGAAGAAAAVVWQPLGELTIRATGPPLWWLLRVAEWSAGAPGATLAVPVGLAGAAAVAGVAAGLLLAIRSRWLRRVLAAAVLGLAVVWVPVRVLWPGWPAGDWTLVACDVGQGDAMVLAAGDGTAVVVDAGPEPRLVDGCLDRLGVRTIAAVVLTHLHADHIDGLPGVLRGRRVDAVILGPMRLPESGFRQVSEQSAAAGVAIREARAGQGLRLGTLTFRVLGPTLPVPRSPAAGAEVANDQSLVLSVDTAVGRVLLTGDVEADGQRDLLRDRVPVAADILKLPHHGSRTTTAEFLRSVGARLVIASAGAGNTFGHPDPAVVQEVRSTGATLVRTDRGGDVAVSRSGGGAIAVGRR